MAAYFNAAINSINSLSGAIGGISTGISSSVNSASSLTNSLVSGFGFNTPPSTGSSSNLTAVTSSNDSAVKATGGAPTEWLNQYISKTYSENGLLKYLYKKLFHDLMPDISGYVLLFISPPILSGYASANQNYNAFSGSSYWAETSQLYPVLATNFTPPIIQVNSGALVGPSGTQHHPTKIGISDSMSVTFIETMDLDIYTFHKSWIEYILRVVDGSLSPDKAYIQQRTIDYCSSFYFLKFKPNLEEIQYIGKAVNLAA